MVSGPSCVDRSKGSTSIDFLPRLIGRGGIWAALLVLLLTLPALPAVAQPEFPKLTGRVVDAANVLPPEAEVAIGAKLQQLETTTTRQLVVATVPDLGGYDIADYGYQLGRTWGIGQKEDDNGALLIVAPNERRVRIEVGYGLEPVLTDAMSSLIIQRQILPRFRQGDLPGGVEAGVDAIVEQLKLPPEQARAIAAKAAQAQTPERGGIGIGSIFWLAIIFFWLLPALFGRRRGRRYRRSSGVGEAILWGLATSAMNNRSRGGGWGGGGFGGGGFGGGGFGGGGGSFGGGGASGGW